MKLAGKFGTRSVYQRRRKLTNQSHSIGFRNWRPRIHQINLTHSGHVNFHLGHIVAGANSMKDNGIFRKKTPLGINNRIHETMIKPSDS